MYTLDRKFFNKDGSINYEKACAAGRLERSNFFHDVVKAVYGTILKTVSLGKKSARNQMSHQRV